MQNPYVREGGGMVHVPVIVLGSNRTLRFRNVDIVNADQVRLCRDRLSPTGDLGHRRIRGT